MKCPLYISAHVVCVFVASSPDATLRATHRHYSCVIDGGITICPPSPVMMPLLPWAFSPPSQQVDGDFQDRVDESCCPTPDWSTLVTKCIGRKAALLSCHCSARCTFVFQHQGSRIYISARRKSEGEKKISCEGIARDAGYLV